MKTPPLPLLAEVSSTLALAELSHTTRISNSSLYKEDMYGKLI
ncbi:hypothetical protein FORC60_4496 [Bacillus cereus]|nr:hypothetical protein FORC60_4496 [Bacillus cereus]